MKNTTSKKTAQRRAFLKGAAIASTAAGSGLMTAQAAAEPVAAEPTPAVTKTYRETAHIRDYYRLARF